ncbi:MAG: isoprenylcysteine carboxylmethyltransferase family protein [Proteobacteria bacterium]|nr:isoprenylcysteine carboxylmethyltransferase family protein [Pseudomonadota bacterium]
MMRMLHPVWSYGLVSLQFISIGAILMTGAWWSSYWMGLSAQLIGVILGLWAVYVMRLGRFNIVPDPRDNSDLVVQGPYRWIRHPMYAAILWVILPMVVSDTSMQRLAWLLVLVLTLILKLHYEEYLLNRRFGNYRAYQQRSYKLLPWIF